MTDTTYRVDWGDFANQQLFAFVVGRYGAPAAEIVFGVTRNAVYGRIHQKGVEAVSSNFAKMFDAALLAEEARRLGRKHAGLVAKDGEAAGSALLASLDDESVAAAQKRFFELWSIGSRGRSVVPSGVRKKHREPSLSESKPSSEEPNPLDYYDVVCDEKVSPEPVEHRALTACVPYVAVKVEVTPPEPAPAVTRPSRPRRSRVEPAVDARAPTAHESRVADSLLVEVDSLPGDDENRLALLKKNFPNAVNLFRARMTGPSGGRVNQCRTPLWNLSADCLARYPKHRIRYDESYKDASRYVCGNPTDSAEIYVCSTCRSSLGGGASGLSASFFKGRRNGTVRRTA